MKKDNSNTVQHTPGKLFSHDNIVMVEVGNNTYHLAQCWSPVARDTNKNGTDEAKANAERICKAWNEYDTLKKNDEIATSLLKVYEEEVKALQADNESLTNYTNYIGDKIAAGDNEILSYQQWIDAGQDF